MTNYRYMGSHAYEVTSGDERIPVGPGEFVILSSDDVEHVNNVHLFEDGMLKSEEELQNPPQVSPEDSEPEPEEVAQPAATGGKE